MIDGVTWNGGFESTEAEIPLIVFVCSWRDTVAKLCSGKNHATLIRRSLRLGKNESLQPWFGFDYCVSTPAK